MLSRVVENTSTCDLDKGDLLREVTVKIGKEKRGKGRKTKEKETKEGKNDKSKKGS